MRILVVGSDANAYAIAKHMSDLKNVDLVFVAPGNSYIKDFANSIDIQDDNIVELLDFAKANEITLTVVASEKAIAASIADTFSSEDLNIFAPTINSARLALSKSSGKKLMYKLRVQTPKFGIFDKENIAIDYVRKSKFPLVVKSDGHDPLNKAVVCHTFSKAKFAIEKLFENFNKKIVVDDFVDAHEFSLYVVTDGFTALPLSTITKVKKNDNELDDYAFYSPDYSVSDELLAKIMQRVVYPVIDEIAKGSAPYVGILGIDFLVSKNSFQVIDFNPFFNSGHLQTLLPLLENNLYELFLAASNGSLSDDYDHLAFKNLFSYSREFDDASFIKDLEIFDGESDIYYSYSFEGKLILTALASTITSARANLFSFVDSLVIEEV